MTEKALLLAAGALEQKSEHPLARAVLELAKERGMDCGDLTEFTAVPGNGLTGGVAQAFWQAETQPSSEDRR